MHDWRSGRARRTTTDDRRRTRRMRMLALLPLALAVAGCQSLADRLVAPRTAPTGIDSRVQAQMEDGLGIRRQRWQPVDGPALAYRIVTPARYGMQYRYQRTAEGLKIGMTMPRAVPPSLPTRGTVVYLHGWGMDGASMLPWAIALAQQGYLGIVVDLRNHGGSATGPAGYGTREGQDVAALVQALRREGTITGPVRLFGVSYGAVAAIFAARQLQDSIEGVVALEPFANAGEGIRSVIAFALDSPTNSLRSRTFTAFARRRYDQARIDAAVAEAGLRLGLDLTAIDVHAALASFRGCTLILHGTDDPLLPVVSARALAQGAPRAQLVELDDENHFSLPVRIDLLAAPVDAWMTRLGQTPCPQFQVTAD